MKINTQFNKITLLAFCLSLTFILAGCLSKGYEQNTATKAVSLLITNKDEINNWESAPLYNGTAVLADMAGFWVDSNNKIYAANDFAQQISNAPKAFSSINIEVIKKAISNGGIAMPQTLNITCEEFEKEFAASMYLQDKFERVSKGEGRYVIKAKFRDEAYLLYEEVAGYIKKIEPNTKNSYNITHTTKVLYKNDYKKAEDSISLSGQKINLKFPAQLTKFSTDYKGIKYQYIILPSSTKYHVKYTLTIEPINNNKG